MKQLLVMTMAVAVLASCSKDEDPIIIVPPSSGSTLTLNGGSGTSSAVNSVYVDFSTDKQDSVKRNSWDLGFYCGSEFKIILNNTKGVTATAVNKTDINLVTAADVDLNILKIGQGLGSFSIIDDPRESSILNKTAIGEISATDANNKVYIINAKGITNNTPVPTDSTFKIKVLRKGTGYTLQYAKLSESTFKTLDINKSNDYNFQFISLFSGSLMNVEPTKLNWDISWTWSLYVTPPSQGSIPYGYSDLVIINTLAGVTAYERAYASPEIATEAYSKFNKDSVAKYTFSNNRWTIGSNWRVTAPSADSPDPVGIRKYRFYLVKDAVGNSYKLKFIAAGLAGDGGTRGKPQIAYELIK